MAASAPVHIPRTVTIGDSYSDGSGGVQVDLKTFAALSTLGMSVVTGLVARKISDVNTIHIVPEDFVSSQFHAVINDRGVDALKIGMLFTPSLIECVLSLLTKVQIPVVVVDPIMVTTQSFKDSLTVLRDQLLPIATLITPTLNEAAILLDRDIVSLDDMKRAAQDLHHLGPKNVLIQGSHLALNASLQTSTDDDEDIDVVDVLFDGLHFTLFKNSRMTTRNTHDARCILSAAITAYLACGLDMIRAVQHASGYTHSAVKKPLIPDRDKELLKNKMHLLVDELPDDSLYRTEEHKELAVNKQQQQQKSQKDTGDKVVVVSSEYWIDEPRILPQKYSLVQLLKNSCSQEWFDYTHHPFLQALANGTLPHASFKHYLTQDYIFLIHYARCNALAAYKSSTMKEILFAANIVCHIGREMELHLSYCAEWGIDVESLACIEEAPANLAYTRFILDCGMTGDLLDLRVALLSCLLGYGEIGLRLFNDPATNRDSPYWKWISNLSADDYQKACREGEQLIERLADECGVWHTTSRIKKLTATFKTVTKLEIGFWDMGLNVER